MNNSAAATAAVVDTLAAAAARAPALVSTTTLAVDSAVLAVVALAIGNVPSRVDSLQLGLALPDFLQVQTLGPH